MVLVAIAVIALFTGGAKGLIKQLSGAFCVLLALVLATMLTSLIMTPVKTTGVFQNFVGTATNWFTNEMFKAEVTSAEELATIYRTEEPGKYSVAWQQQSTPVWKHSDAPPWDNCAAIT